MKKTKVKLKILEKMKKDPKEYVVQKLSVFTDELLSELEKQQDLKIRKSMFHKVMIVFLGIYSCFAEGEVHAKNKDLMLHFSSSVGDIQRNEKLDSAIQDLVSHMYFAMNTIEDKESIIWTIIHRLICLYVAFAVSDKSGSIICHELGKERSKEWKKFTPMTTTSNILEKKEKNSELPFDFSASLAKYSFWVQNIQTKKTEL